MTALESGRFVTFLDNLFFVYSHINTTGVLSTAFPNKETFFEDKIADINYSFLKFLDANPEIEESQQTSLETKFQNHEYTSVFEIFHDLKIACIVKLLQFEDNVTVYSAVDQFYRVSVEILLRETIKLGVSLNNKKRNAEQENSNSDGDVLLATETDNMEEQIQKQISQLKPENTTDILRAALEKDFDIITSVFFNTTGKALSIFASGNVPFFSSLNNFQSELDDREPIIDPALGISINNVIPSISQESDETLGKLSQTELKVPNIKQILENYMHPNWLRLISSQWLKHGSGVTSLNFSFAPTYDETQSIISNDWKGLTWCQQVGFKKLVEAKRHHNEALANEQESSLNAAVESTLGSAVVRTEGKSHDRNEEHNDADPTGDDTEQEEEHDEEDDDELQVTFDPAQDKIDVRNILQYDSNTLVDESEAEIIKSNNAQATISDLLIQLSQLRNDRIEKQKKHTRINKKILSTTGGKIFKPTPDELKIYNKVKRFITGLIGSKDIKPAELDIEFDRKIPVLQHTYQGTLPASAGLTSTKTSKSKRRR